MKNGFCSVIALFSVVSLLTFLHELARDVKFHESLENRGIGIPEDSETARKAENDYEVYQVNELRASEKKTNKVLWLVFKLLLYAFCASLILVEKFREKIMKIAKTIPFQAFGTSSTELSFITLFCILFYVVSGNWYFDLVQNPSLIANILFHLLLFLVIIPGSVILLTNLFSIYGSRFIIACYLALFLKLSIDFIFQDPVQLDKMEKIGIESFSPNLQSYLRENNLEESVYSEKIKSKHINAALVGWGSQERIEIYGDHKEFSDKEFESILMHEVGHSQDKSLFKKMTMLFLVEWIEMVLMLVLYTKVAPKYAGDGLSVPGAFFLLFILYHTFISDWVFIVHKITSQAAELNADLVARSHGLGPELSNVLFKISISSRDFLHSTGLFNYLSSYHPTIYTRIEYLNSS